MEFKDYYKVLGVDKSASQDEIKKKFRKLARTCHPDKVLEMRRPAQKKNLRTRPKPMRSWAIQKNARNTTS